MVDFLGVFFIPYFENIHEISSVVSCFTTDRFRGSLTSVPQAETAIPAAKMFFAALTSRSCVAPQAQLQTRSFNVNVTCFPQQEQVLLDGKNLSITTNSRPYQLDLYSNMVRNCRQPCSEIHRARLRFFTIFDTAKSSIAITWFSRTIEVDSLCRKSVRMLTTF